MTGRLRPSSLVAVLWAAGCATSTSARVKPEQAVDSGRAYLYGRFFINAPLSSGPSLQLP